MGNTDREIKSTCAKCGGDFLPPVVIDGLVFHQGCAVMSHGPHRHVDYVNITNKLWNLWEAAMKFEYNLSKEYDDQQLRNALLDILTKTYGQSVLEAHRAKLKVKT